MTFLIGHFCEKHAHQPKTKMNLETYSTAKAGLLMTVLQDQVLGRQVHPESLHRASYPSHASPSLSSSLAEYYRVNSLPRCCLRLIRYSFFSLSILSPHFSRRFSSSVPKLPVSLESLWCKLLGKTSLPVIFQDKSS